MVWEVVLDNVPDDVQHVPENFSTLIVSYLTCFSNFNRETLEKILARGHSRVPVYDGNPRNIIGLLLVI
jgi:Mg2+/Co2+ transporter CorC